MDQEMHNQQPTDLSVVLQRGLVFVGLFFLRDPSNLGASRLFHIIPSTSHLKFSFQSTPWQQMSTELPVHTMAANIL